jgi:hypothetical protein
MKIFYILTILIDFWLTQRLQCRICCLENVIGHLLAKATPLNKISTNRRYRLCLHFLLALYFKKQFNCKSFLNKSTTTTAAWICPYKQMARKHLNNLFTACLCLYETDYYNFHIHRACNLYSICLFQSAAALLSSLPTLARTVRDYTIIIKKMQNMDLY